jgi:hypothetical protein
MTATASRQHDADGCQDLPPVIRATAGAGPGLRPDLSNFS